ncbi:phosphoglycerate kinase [Anaplasma capra]|uniref:phosphoglycerate kinase n=1 Tax=Anaplasma capra TaxID=1562740 RepID=UPI0021D56F70|nr:phosphoglycerate kinase [Anaplasma capra]MCU7611210.1 phosphoglycerate kinase [Anaplasma capra]MCU7612286.1 phosphoglycerate kinase [Anaplasma capra]
MKNIRTLPGVQNSSVRGCRVLLRVDFNVPVECGQVRDRTRIERVIPTVSYLVKSGAKVVLASHFGRPKGVDMNFSLEPLVGAISEVLGLPITFVGDCLGERVCTIVNALPWGSVVLLENLRFHEGEEKNDPAFAERLAAIADLYVNDAFSCAHRVHASVDAITQFLPSTAGLSLQDELRHLGSIVGAHPVAAVIGGAKTSSKIPMLCNLAQKVDFLVLGGGLSNSFLRASGRKIGSSVHEFCDDAALAVLESAGKSNCEVILPVDHVVAHGLDCSAQMKANEDVREEDRIFDIGEHTSRRVTEVLSRCKTVFWNGPMGVFEREAFASGTFGLVRDLVRLKRDKGVSTIVGGGDSVFAIKASGHAPEDFSYISTGGGALLHFLSVA